MLSDSLSDFFNGVILIYTLVSVLFNGTVSSALNLEKFQCLNLCYLGLYHPKSILSLSNPRFERDVPDKCVSRNVDTIWDNHDTNSIAIDDKTCLLRIWMKGPMLTELQIIFWFEEYFTH